MNWVGYGLFQDTVLSFACNEEHLVGTSVRIAGASSGIQTRPLLNADHACYCCINLVGAISRVSVNKETNRNDL